MSETQTRPILALTMGDPVGVGPEIMVQALAAPQIYQVCRPLIIGDLPALTRARARLAPEMQMQVLESPGAGRYEPGTINVLALSHLGPEDLEYGRPTPATPSCWRRKPAPRNMP